MLAVLPVAGSNVYPADATTVEKVPPSRLPCTDRVCTRVPQALAGGTRSVTLPTLVEAPRSTWSHCGNALLALSQ